MSIVAAFDWGGTWIRAALVDATGAMLAHERERRPGSPAEQLALASSLAARLRAGATEQVAGVGIGIAGVVREHGVIASAANLGLTGMDLRAELETRIGLKVRVVNDTQAAALAESAAVAGADTTVLITVGTGIGGAIVQDGQLFVGRGAAGDFGHTPVLIDGPVCKCGSQGCLEQIVSGRTLDDVAADLAARGVSAVLGERLRHGRPLHAGDLDDAARASEPEPTEAVERAAGALVTGLRAVGAACDPDVIVLGGGVLPQGSFLLERVLALWEVRRSPWSSASLVPAHFGDEAGLRGAALLFAPSAPAGPS